MLRNLVLFKKECPVIESVTKILLHNYTEGINPMLRNRHRYYLLHLQQFTSESFTFCVIMQEDFSKWLMICNGHIKVLIYVKMFVVKWILHLPKQFILLLLFVQVQSISCYTASHWTKSRFHHFNFSTGHSWLQTK